MDLHFINYFAGKILTYSALVYLPVMILFRFYYRIYRKQKLSLTFRSYFSILPFLKLLKTESKVLIILYRVHRILLFFIITSIVLGLIVLIFPK